MTGSAAEAGVEDPTQQGEIAADAAADELAAVSSVGGVDLVVPADAPALTALDTSPRIAPDAIAAATPPADSGPAVPEARVERPAPSQPIRAEAEIQSVAGEALTQTFAELDGPGWTMHDDEYGIPVGEKHVPGASFPMFKAELVIPSQEAVPLASVCAVAFSHTCRRYYDMTYSHASMLGATSDGVSSMMAYFTLGTPISAPDVFVAVRRFERAVDAAGGERITSVVSRAPPSLVEAYRDEVSRTSNGREYKSSPAHTSCMDLRRLPDGSLSLRFSLFVDQNAFWLPGFIVKKFIAKAPSSALRQIWLMASNGMLPKRRLAVTAGDDNELFEEHEVSGRQLEVSGFLRSVFVA